MEESKTQTQIEVELLEKCLQTLREHFENVQIFVSRDADGDGTIGYDYGSGNIHARHGHARSWCLKMDEFTKIDAAESACEGGID